MSAVGRPSAPPAAAASLLLARLSLAVECPSAPRATAASLLLHCCSRVCPWPNSEAETERRLRERSNSEGSV